MWCSRMTTVASRCSRRSLRRVTPRGNPGWDWLAARHVGLSVRELLGTTRVIVHGTTRATNAILTRWYREERPF